MARKLIQPRDDEHGHILDVARKYRSENREKRRKLNNDWISKNRERYNAAKYHYRERCKVDAMSHYGTKIECSVCGFNDIRGLCLDHINDNGSEHRKLLRIPSRNSDSAGMSTYEALKREDWPDGLQILCSNCNTIKEWERKKSVRIKNKFYNPNNLDEYNKITRIHTS